MSLLLFSRRCDSENQTSTLLWKNTFESAWKEWTRRRGWEREGVGKGADRRQQREATKAQTKRKSERPSQREG